MSGGVPRVRTSRIDDPVLAAEIAWTAIRRAEELMAEGPFPPDVLARVAALIGPIPVKARKPTTPASAP